MLRHQFGQYFILRLDLLLQISDSFLECVEHCNNVRLNRAIGYITPKDMLAGHQQEIQADRDRKLEAAREQQKNRRQRAA